MLNFDNFDNLDNLDIPQLNFFEFTDTPNVNLRESFLIRKKEIESILQFSFVNMPELQKELDVINTVINQGNT